MNLDRNSIARHFGRAAASYDQHAALQREVCERLIGRLDGLKFQPATILDLGCGTGFGAQALTQRFPEARVIAMDLALPMLKQAQRRRGWWNGLWRKGFEPVAGDAAALPLVDESIDLVFSSLMLQWIDEPADVLASLRRVLRPGGLLLLSSFGLDTLTELRQAWATVDEAEHVSRFTDVQRMGSALTRAGFAEPVLDTDWITTTYSQPRHLLSELKGIGATNARRDRAHGLTPPARLKAMLKAYERFQQNDGRYPASWEILYASAWAPDRGQPVRQGGGEQVSIGLDQIGRIQR